MGVLVKGFRQFYLLRFNDIRIPFKQNMTIFIAGLSLTFAPAGVGAMIKCKFLNDNHSIPIRNTVPIITVEIYHEFLGMVTLIAITVLFYNTLEARIAIILGTIISAIIYANLRYPKTLYFFKKFFRRLKSLNNLMGDGDEFQKSFNVLTSVNKMLATWALTEVSILLDLVATYLIFLSFNVSIFDFIKISQMYLTSLLLGQISFLPNGIGVTDGSFIGILAANKINLALATSLVLVTRFIGLWFKTGIGFLALKFLKTSKQ